MRLIVMKKGGQPGKVAINPELVTEVRSSSGPFTDIYFGAHYVAVEGAFDNVIALLQDASPDDSKRGEWFPRPEEARAR